MKYWSQKKRRFGFKSWCLVVCRTIREIDSDKVLDQRPRLLTVLNVDLVKSESSLKLRDNDNNCLYLKKQLIEFGQMVITR